MIERVRFRVRGRNVFLRKVRDLSLLDKIKSTENWQSINIEAEKDKFVRGNTLN